MITMKTELPKELVSSVTKKELEQIRNPEKWSDVYLKYNGLAVDRNDFGEYSLHLDKVAIQIAEIQLDKAYLQFPSKKERMQYMIENGFYKEKLITSGVSLEDIEELYETYDEYDVGEQAFYSVYQFIHTQSYKVVDSFVKNYPYEKPMARYDDKYIILETRADRVIAIALDTVGAFGKEQVKKSIKMMALRNAHPSSPTYTNSGIKDAGQPTSCFILKYDDTIDSIADMNSYTLQLSKMGGGLGYDLTNLRAKGEMVKKADNRTHGLIAIAKMLEQNLRFADQDGKRRGSGAVYVSSWHRDWYDLLDAKKENTDENTRLSDLSLGLIVDDFYMTLLENNQDIYTFYPHTIFMEYGVYLSDIDMSKMYYELVANPRVKKEKFEFEFIKETLASVASESGYPYFFFKDTVNEKHAFKTKKIYCSNLCTEILQRQDFDEYVTEYGEEVKEYRGVQCTLTSINVAQVMKNKNLRESMFIQTYHANGTLDQTNFKKIRPVEKAVRELRGIAVGYANLQGYLAQNKIPYESEYAIEFSRAFASAMNFYSIEASHSLVEKYGKFKDFEDTTYADGTYFNQYLENDYSPQSDRIKELFEGIKLPTKEDWIELKAKVMKDGLANAYRLAVAPTNSISYSMGGTQGIMPNTDHIENRKTGASSSAYYPMPDLKPENYFMYKSAYNVSDYRYLDLIATWQEHIDQGISTTLFITDDYTSAEWFKVILYGWKIGLKTLYYTKPKISSFEECESCQ